MRLGPPYEQCVALYSSNPCSEISKNFQTPDAVAMNTVRSLSVLVIFRAKQI